MLSSVEQAFVGRDEKQAPLKRLHGRLCNFISSFILKYFHEVILVSITTVAKMCFLSAILKKIEQRCELNKQFETIVNRKTK